MSTETQVELPFEPNLDSLSFWLSSLPQNDRERYASLYAGLQALNEAKLLPRFYFDALEKIRGPVFQASASLGSAVLGKPFPLDTGVRKLVKLSAQFQADLAQGYYALAVGEDFSSFDAEERGRIMHSIFRSYNQMMLRCALMYEAPASAIWRRLGETYRLAERGGLLQWAESCPELPQSASCSVEQLYLRMLAFWLAVPYRLEQPEIQLVFRLVQQHGDLLSFSRTLFVDERKADFSVDLDSGDMPSSLARESGDGKPGLRYLFTEPLRRMIAMLGRPPLDKESGVSATLSNYLRIRLGGSLDFLPEKKSLNSTLVAGFQRLVAAMTHLDAKIEAGGSLGEFKLLALDEHLSPTSGLGSSKTSGAFSVPFSDKKALHGESAGGRGLLGGIPCRLYPASMPGYYIVDTLGQDLRGKNLLGIFTDNKLIQFGLLCPGRNERASNAYGFQLLASPVSLMRVSFDAAPKKAYTGFVSPAGDNVFSLIVEPVRLRGGDGLGVGRIGQHGILERHRISRLLQKTAEFCQYEIVPEARDIEL